MPALPKFLVLVAIFLSASNAHAFTSLSLVAGNQVRLNHLNQFEELMSKPTNESSREPIREPTIDRKKCESIVSCSHITRITSTPTFQLIVTSVSNNNALFFNDKPSSKFQLVVASITKEFLKGSSNKTAQCTMNNLRQSQSFIHNVLIDWWQCSMEIDKVNFQQVGNSASTQLVGSCQNKKSERVGNSASTQLVSFCHNKKLG